MDNIIVADNIRTSNAEDSTEVVFVNGHTTRDNPLEHQTQINGTVPQQVNGIASHVNGNVPHSNGGIVKQLNNADLSYENASFEDTATIENGDVIFQFEEDVSISLTL